MGAPQPKAWNGHGYCQSVVAYNLAKGTINGVDVSGLTLIGVVHIPGNILEGNWKQAVLVDDRASDEQMDAMLQCFSGALGGPLADLASLVGERVSIERAKIEHSIVDGAGTLKVRGQNRLRDAALPWARRQQSRPGNRRGAAGRGLDRAHVLGVRGRGGLKNGLDFDPSGRGAAW